MNKKKFLKSIADESKTKIEDILFYLATNNHDIVWAVVANVTLLSDMIEMDFDTIDIPISNEMALYIASNGIWQGDRIKKLRPFEYQYQQRDWTFAKKNDGSDNIINDKSELPGQDEVDSADTLDNTSSPDNNQILDIKSRKLLTQATFREKISITTNHLFVYENDFSCIEQEINNTKTELSERGYNNLYKLIWVLKDMLIDDEERNYNFPFKRKFTSAAQLIQQIEHYDLSGLGKRTLENHFQKANDIIIPLKTKFTQK